MVLRQIQVSQARQESEERRKENRTGGKREEKAYAETEGHHSSGQP